MGEDKEHSRQRQQRRLTLRSQIVLSTISSMWLQNRADWGGGGVKRERKGSDPRELICHAKGSGIYLLGSE